jgi:hypothetical protein
MVWIQELTDLRDYIQSSSEDSTRLSTPDRASPVLILLNQKLYKWRTTSRVWYLAFHQQGVFIAVQGGVTDLIKLVMHQVLAGWPRHMVGRPPSLASTNFQLWIPCYHLLESVPVKPIRERLQSGVGRPRSLVGQPPPRPTGQWPLHTATLC